MFTGYSAERVVVVVNIFCFGTVFTVVLRTEGRGYIQESVRLTVPKIDSFLAKQKFFEGVIADYIVFTGPSCTKLYLIYPYVESSKEEQLNLLVLIICHKVLRKVLGPW